jgi:GT2 family glycosyltransferase/spore maturation protein CgeB
MQTREIEGDALDTGSAQGAGVESQGESEAQVESEQARSRSLARRVLRLEGDLRVRDREEQAARRELRRLSREFEALRRESEGRTAQAEQERAKDQAARLAAERLVEDLREELAGQRRSGEALGQELDSAQAELARLRRALESSERQHQRSAGEHAARSRGLQQTISALSVGLGHVREDIERAQISRAWRYGHSVSRALARLVGRRRRTQGALAAALARIERVQSATRALPPPRGGGSSGAAGSLPRALAALPAPAAYAEEDGGPVGLAAPDVLPLSAERLARMRSLRAELAGRLREQLGPVPGRASWPLVSVIVPTRDGRHNLERLFEGLIEHTDYPSFEVLVVDNASRDDSLSYLRELDTAFPLHVIASEENLSFALANARGAQRAGGELLLFLNNDVEAFEQGWLKELVCALDADGVAAVGATLLHPEGAEEEQPPAIVQHRSIRFRWQSGMVKAFNSGDGEELWECALGSELRAPAVTAACMLIARESFARVGGFEEGYRYGTEDVDLGLKLLMQGGESVGVGRAMLVHRESSSQNRESRDFRRLNRLENRRLFLERWGPRVQLEYRLARLRRDPFWSDGRGAHIAITLTSLDVRDGWGDWYSGHELGDALEAQGWRVSYVQRKGEEWYELPHDLEYLLSLMDPFDLRRVPDHVVTIAWIRNWTERWLSQPWFARADVLLASSQGTAELIERTTGRRTIRFPLAVNPARFNLQPAQQRYAADYVFTGNWWGKDRDIQHALAPRESERVAIYGKDWEKVPELAPYAHGELPYAELPAVYASAKLVLDDTQGPTLPYGALNARVFDALAAGTLPVTNCESGVRELFDEEFPVWSSRDTLRSVLDELLADEPRRQELTRRYREMVLTKHTYANRASRLREIMIEHEQRFSFCLKIGAPDRDAARHWGDLHFAQSLAAELRRRGHRSAVQTLDEWELEDGLLHDVVVHLKGLSYYHPKPGQFNILWSISHPDGLTGEECEGYDLVCVASPLFAEILRSRTATPVLVLEQAADPWTMHPDPRQDLAHDLVYVANSRNVLRPIARDLLPTDRDLAIWGAGWDGLIDTARVLGEHVPNEELRHVYSSAGIVLNDHWDDMREHGYISNRVYDALACGALVLSDEVPGLTERFGDAVACFSSPEQLHQLIDRFLADPRERRRRGELGRQLVLERHTFAHRIDELLAMLDEHLRRPDHARRLRPSGEWGKGRAGTTPVANALPLVVASPAPIPAADAVPVG